VGQSRAALVEGLPSHPGQPCELLELDLHCWVVIPGSDHSRSLRVKDEHLRASVVVRSDELAGCGRLARSRRSDQQPAPPIGKQRPIG
jgi:hypothetical protein